MKCAFCDIVSGDAPAYVVFEDDASLAFLDRRPLFPGHCLLIPKEHFSTLAELDRSLIGPLFFNVRLLAGVVEQTLGAEGTFVAINNKVSQSVPHLHVHIVPRRKGDGLKGFFWPRKPYRDEDHILEVQNKIREEIEALKR